MKLLLDTNVLLWMLAGSPRMSDESRAVVEGDTRAAMVSAVSLAEIALKATIGKLSVGDDLLATIEAIGYEQLSFTARHAERLRRMPLLHRDPFDRMLVAQALVEDVPLMTSDSMLGHYGVRVISP